MSELFKKFIEFAIGNGVVMILGFISTPIVTRLISPEEYGKANMFVTVTSLLILVLMLGIDQAYVRYYNDEKDESKGKFLRKSLKAPLILNIIVGISLLFFYKPISSKIVGEVSFTVMILVLLHSTFSIISNFAMLNVRMKQKGKLYSLLSIINKLSFLIFIFIVYFKFKNNYITVIYATVLANLTMTILAIIYERNDWFSLKKGTEVKTTTKEMFIYGMPFIFSMGLTWLFQSIDKISILAFSGFSSAGYLDNGLYSGAMTIIALLSTFQAAFTTFWTPVAYEKYNTNPEDTEFFSNINQIVSASMLLLSIGLIATKDIIVHLLGEKYNGTQFIFPFLVLMPIMYTISETTVLGINFKKKTKYHIYVSLFSAVTNVLGNVILVPIYGAKGAAISTGISYIIFFLARTYFAGKFYKVNFKMGRLWICVIAVYILAAYSSMYDFNLIILLLTIGSIALVLVMYRNIIKEIILLVKGKLNNG